MLLLIVQLVRKIRSIPLPPDSANHTDHWIFIHYHKTGHDLARRLGQMFQIWPCSAVVFHSFFRRVPIQNQLRLLHGTNLAVVAAPDVQMPWTSVFLNQTNSHLKMVHFVRDPFDMILSAYLYHSQLSPPGKEAWLKYPAFNPCDVDSRQLEGFSNYIGDVYGNKPHFKALLADVQNICMEVYRTRSELGARGYSAALRTLSVTDGLLLEAARSIINARGGDILRMATNALYERNTTGGHSYRVLLPDFPVGNASQFALSSHKLFTYLMDAPASRQDRFWDCMDVPTAVQRSLEIAFVSESTGSSPNRSTHVTRDLISRDERHTLKQILEKHAVFGPILSTVQKILAR